MKITINTSSFAQGDVQPLERLRAKGIVPVMNPHKKTMTAKQVIEFCADADGMIAGTEPLTTEVLAQLPLLKVISRCGTGLDHIDLKAAQARGIKVFNTPAAVVQLAVYNNSAAHASAQGESNNTLVASAGTPHRLGQREGIGIVIQRYRQLGNPL